MRGGVPGELPNERAASHRPRTCLRPSVRPTDDDDDDVHEETRICIRDDLDNDDDDDDPRERPRRFAAARRAHRGARRHDGSEFHQPTLRQAWPGE